MAHHLQHLHSLATPAPAVFPFNTAVFQSSFQLLPPSYDAPAAGALHHRHRYHPYHSPSNAIATTSDHVVDDHTNAATSSSDDDDVVDDDVVEDDEPALSDHMIAMFARSELARRKKQAAEAAARKGQHFMHKLRADNDGNEAPEVEGDGALDLDGRLVMAADERRAMQERLYGAERLRAIAELECRLSSLHNQHCDMYNPIVWPQLPIKL